jgi:SAM-dependent methyltransferase
VELVYSLSVLEHVQHPVLVAAEVHRVLQPGGYFVGTVAFLESFHLESKYHHTHLGTYETLDSAGLQVRQIVPHPTWSGFRALAMMTGFPDGAAWSSPSRRRVALASVAAAERLQRFTWRRRGYSEHERRLHSAGGFAFAARRPPTDAPVG